MTERIEKIIIFEDEVKANSKRNTCPKCGRIHFSKIASDRGTVEVCAVCLGLFDDEK